MLINAYSNDNHILNYMTRMELDTLEELVQLHKFRILSHIGQEQWCQWPSRDPMGYSLRWTKEVAERWRSKDAQHSCGDIWWAL